MLLGDLEVRVLHVILAVGYRVAGLLSSFDVGATGKCNQVLLITNGKTI